PPMPGGGGGSGPAGRVGRRRLLRGPPLTPVPGPAPGGAPLGALERRQGQAVAETDLHHVISQGGTRSAATTRSIIALSCRSGTSKGPATTAPSVISSAMTTPPLSYGFTIQLNPRNVTSRSVGASGCLALSTARSMPGNTAATSASVHARGSRATGEIIVVVARLVRRSQMAAWILTDGGDPST